MKNSNADVWFSSKSRLSILGPVLKKWIQLVQQYSKASGGKDACYFYTERANIGILAAAAWATQDWVALEEYGTEKRGDNGAKRAGRCDLMLAHKNGDEQTCFAFEGKQEYQNIDSDHSYAKVLEKWNEAWADAGDLQRWEGDHRVAACFVMPYSKLNQPKNETRFIDKCLQSWIDELKETRFEELEMDAAAWVFPDESREITGDGKYSKYIYPGVFLLLKERQRANRSK